MSMTIQANGTYLPTRTPRALRKDVASGADQKLRQQAGQLVAQTFYAPMLEMMRNSPFKDEKFSGGNGGAAFAQLLDQHLMGKAARGEDKLVDAIVDRMSGKRFHDYPVFDKQPVRVPEAKGMTAHVSIP